MAAEFCILIGQGFWLLSNLLAVVQLQITGLLYVNAYVLK